MLLFLAQPHVPLQYRAIHTIATIQGSVKQSCITWSGTTIGK